MPLQRIKLTVKPKSSGSEDTHAQAGIQTPMSTMQPPTTAAPPQLQGFPPSPARPPVEPLSPIPSPRQTKVPSGSTRQTFTHTQQLTQYVPQPPPQLLSLEENPDAIALRAAMLVLQRQAAKAQADIIELEKARARAREDPEGFRDAIKTGKIRTKTDGLFDLSLADVEGSGEDDDDSEEDDKDGNEVADPQNQQRQTETKSTLAQGEDTVMNDTPEAINASAREEDDEPMPDSDQPGPSTIKKGKKTEKWPQIPARQKVVRAPAINWSQYAVVGDSLNKLHEDQRKNPAEGVPQQITPDGRVKSVEGGKQRSATLAAPYDPLKDGTGDKSKQNKAENKAEDKVEKMSTRKGGKR